MESNATGFLCDYEQCEGEVALRKTIQQINTSGYTLISVSQREDTYTVFFRRPVDG